ncbi:M9 family metallopeptidase [Streptomyces sp. NPDC047017]|uniref:M9 family metallopeptidase n=1 Tax=Streptomyces sp. NPDC047017 TaxID=3155024 RepID=UPI0033FC8D18
MGGVVRTPLVRRSLGAVLPLALAWTLGAGMLARPAGALPRSTATTAHTTARSGTAADPAPPPTAQTAATDTAHVATGRPTASRIPPTAASTAPLKQPYGHTASPPPRPSASYRTGKGKRSATMDCAASDFTGRTGSALVRQIEASTTDCVNTLFNLTGSDASGAFRESQMVSVAYALRDGSAAYPGDSSTGMPQLVLYLRAGYYVQYYAPGTVGPYGSALRTAIRSGLDAFFASAHAGDVSDANGETLSEAVTLIDSAGENARYLYVLKRLLAAYDTSWNSSWWMLNAVNNVYTVTFRGHQVPEFVTAVQADPSLIDALYAFASGHLALLGTEQSYLTSNAGRELGRFLQHPALRDKVRPLAAALLKSSAITGATAPLWVGVAAMADSYDKDDCSFYGTCDLQGQLARAVLTADYPCSASITIKAQQMTSAELASTCTGLRDQDAYFHRLVRDKGPVANDGNSTIEVVVFDSSTDYQTYAGALYGIDTDNGGMYLEGDPAAAGNQPRFIAYEAEWLRPDFQIWNLNHEYTHYLDGRFDLYGDFDAGVATPTVWWIEGFAEYVSYSYRGVAYPEAMAEAGRGTYALSALFDTTYANDTTRVYRWGYLAVRYMLEKHPADMDTVLGFYRTGDWNAARAYLTGTIGTRYDSDWRIWLAACAAGDCGTGGTEPPGGTVPECADPDVRALGRDCLRGGRSAAAGDDDYLYLDLPSGVDRLTLTTSGGTGDADLYYSGSGWATATSYTSRSTGAGNDHTLTVVRPPAGYNYVTLHGAGSFSGVSVTAHY